eukprot:1143226-Pelagomonas_calceolata.AAC.4
MDMRDTPECVHHNCGGLTLLIVLLFCATGVPDLVDLTFAAHCACLTEPRTPLLLPNHAFYPCTGAEKWRTWKPSVRPRAKRPAPHWRPYRGMLSWCVKM